MEPARAAVAESDVCEQEAERRCRCGEPGALEEPEVE